MDKKRSAKIPGLGFTEFYMATVSKTNLSFISGCMGSNKASLAILLVESTGLGVCGGDLYGGSAHHTGLDYPARVVECSCGGNGVSACRSGAPEPVLTNPSNGALVISVVQAGSGWGWTSGGEVCDCE